MIQVHSSCCFICILDSILTLPPLIVQSPMHLISIACMEPNSSTRSTGIGVILVLTCVAAPVPGRLWTHAPRQRHKLQANTIRDHSSLKSMIGIWHGFVLELGKLPLKDYARGHLRLRHQYLPFFKQELLSDYSFCRTPYVGAWFHDQAAEIRRALLYFRADVFHSCSRQVLFAGNSPLHFAATQTRRPEPLLLLRSGSQTGLLRATVYSHTCHCKYSKLKVSVTSLPSSVSCCCREARPVHCCHRVKAEENFLFPMASPCFRSCNTIVLILLWIRLFGSVSKETCERKRS